MPEPDLGSKSSAHTGDTDTEREGKRELAEDWGGDTGLALPCTTQTSAEHCQGKGNRGEEHNSNSHLLNASLKFHITQSLELSGTVSHVKCSGLEALCLSETKREERKRQLKDNTERSENPKIPEMEKHISIKQVLSIKRIGKTTSLRKTPPKYYVSNTTFF